MLLLCGNMPYVLNKMGQSEQALDRVLQGMALSGEHGTPFDIMRGQLLLGDTYVMLGQPAAGIPVLEDALRIAGELGDRRMHGLVLASLGVAHRELGDNDTAVSLLRLCRSVQAPAHGSRSIGWSSTAPPHTLASSPVTQGT